MKNPLPADIQSAREIIKQLESSQEKGSKGKQLVYDMKPLGIKSYGSIPHLPGSRLGPGDHACHFGMAKIATEKTRDKHDYVVVQEKLDGSNVGIAKIAGEIVPLTRAGYVANTSKFEQHHLFYDWVMSDPQPFKDLLDNGERLCGEWLLQAHGTIYLHLPGPFMAFDLMRGNDRLPWIEFESRLLLSGIDYIHAIHEGSALSIDAALKKLGDHGRFDALDGPEGLVYRVHTKGKVNFLVKYVKPGKIDGKYLPEISGSDPVWNWSLSNDQL